MNLLTCLLTCSEFKEPKITHFASRGGFRWVQQIEHLTSKMLFSLDSRLRRRLKNILAHEKLVKDSSILIGRKAKNDENYDLLIQHLRSEMRRKNQILNQINSFFTHSV